MSDDQRCPGCGRKLYSIKDESVRRDGHERGCELVKTRRLVGEIADTLDELVQVIAEK